MTLTCLKCGEVLDARFAGKAGESLAAQRRLLRIGILPVFTQAPSSSSSAH